MPTLPAHSCNMDSTGLPAVSIHVHVVILALRFWIFHRKKMFIHVTYACMCLTFVHIHVNSLATIAISLLKRECEKQLFVVLALGAIAAAISFL